jgi:uncharacterized membrane protein
MEPRMQHARQDAQGVSATVRADPWVSGFGLLLGLTMFAASLTPSLVPRAALLQGLLGGTLFAFGYGVALSLRWLWRWLELPEPRPGAAAGLSAGAAVLGVSVATLALSHAAQWQNAIRAVMDLPPVETAHPLRVMGLAVATAAVLGVLVWLLKIAVILQSRRLRRYVPHKVAFLASLVIAFGLFGALIDGVLVRYTLQVLDASYAQLDQLIDPDKEQPDAAWQTGSPVSLVDWASIGRAGRRFLDDTPAAADIAAFWSRPARQPLRVYVGLNSAEEVADRARLALEELKRVDAFERAVLVVATPTGTGFMDEAAIETLEYLHEGDVATVAAQYSYLQSPLSLVFEPGYGAETARALLRVVYEHWTGLPAGDRPRLYLHGLSLGALSSERSVQLHEVIGDPFQGALWAGPPFLSPIHTELTAERNPGSPEWLPTFGDGSFARFMNQGGVPPSPDPWGVMRLLYLQHGSDPIVFFSTDILWRRPAWLTPPRAPDVSPAMRWYPVVTALQIAADMALSNEVPRGYGHQYAPASYIDAWVEVTAPDVTDADIARLKERFGG